MIPKVIHYCWFGGNPLPEEFVKYKESWIKFCPDYQIIEWNESNFDIHSNTFCSQAYAMKKWAFVCDYARLKIIYDNGGIYFDTDVELIKNFDPLLSYKCFLGEETSGNVATGLGFGAEKGNPIIKELLDEYNKNFILENGSLDTIPCPVKNTLPLLKHGYQFDEHNSWHSDNCVVLPTTYFCPKDYDTGKLNITNNTYSIHHYASSWHTDTELLIQKIDRNCLNKFGSHLGKIISKALVFLLKLKIRFVNSDK